MDEKLEFHWSADRLTPALKEAVGHIVLTWALIDTEIIQQCKSVIWRTEPTARAPQTFDKRWDLLKRRGAAMYQEHYANEPWERRKFLWFMERLKNMNGRRDSICHGIPAMITKNGRKFEGLIKPSLGHKVDTVHYTIEQVIALATKMNGMYLETVEMAGALTQAFNAANQNFYGESLIDGVMTPATKANRQMLMPMHEPMPLNFGA